MYTEYVIMRLCLTCLQLVYRAAGGAGELSATLQSLRAENDGAMDATRRAHERRNFRGSKGVEVKGAAVSVV